MLVLSEFAAAAVEMGSAGITNPFPDRSMDQAIMQALQMPPEERRERMAALPDVVNTCPVAVWARVQQHAFDQATARKNPD